MTKLEQMEISSLIATANIKGIVATVGKFIDDQLLSFVLESDPQIPVYQEFTGIPIGWITSLELEDDKLVAHGFLMHDVEGLPEYMSIEFTHSDFKISSVRLVKSSKLSKWETIK